MWRWLDIRGRGPLGEFWLVFFLYLLVTAYALLGLSSPDVQDPWRTGLLGIVWTAVLVLWVSAIRRSHDLGDSGLASLYLAPAPLLVATVVTLLHAGAGRHWFSWVPLLGFVAQLLGLIGLYALRDDSAVGHNRYGPDPRLERRVATRLADLPTAPRGGLPWLNLAGRAPRSELLAVAAPWLLSVTILLISLGASTRMTPLAVGAAAALALLTPWLAIAAVRRVHDLGWHGGLALLAAPGPMFFVVAVGLDLWDLILGFLAAPTLILALAMLTFPSQAEANRFGESPRPPRPSAKRRLAADRSEDFVRLRRRLLRHARPALMTTPAEGTVASWLGGAPELPTDVPWPEHEGQPLCFVAQLDLSEVRQAGGPEWLPPGGAISFFLALDEAPYGERTDAATMWRVIHHPADVVLDRRATPSSTVVAWPERRIALNAVKSLPSPDWLGVDVTALEIDDDELDDLADLPSAALGDGPHHLVGGYPEEIQDGQLNLVCALAAAGLDPQGQHSPEQMQRARRDARDWRQLLQLDYDADLGMRWPGDGRFYFLVREKDALKGDFSRAWLLNQFS